MKWLNWIGESRWEEVMRRLEAVEGNAQEAHLRVNALDGKLNQTIEVCQEVIKSVEKHLGLEDDDEH